MLTDPEQSCRYPSVYAVFEYGTPIWTQRTPRSIIVLRGPAGAFHWMPKARKEQSFALKLFLSQTPLRPRADSSVVASSSLSSAFSSLGDEQPATASAAANAGMVSARAKRERSNVMADCLLEKLRGGR